MNNILKVPNKTLLESLQNHTEGEIAFLTDEKIWMIYSNGQWVKVTPKAKDNGNINVSLYDMNKQIIDQLPPLSEQQLTDIIDTLNLWSKANVYMLYGKEISYFTVLTHSEEDIDFNSFGESIISLLKDISDTIYSIDIIDDDSVEIWLRYKDNSTVLYLFNYEGGMVTYGR